MNSFQNTELLVSIYYELLVNINHRGTGVMEDGNNVSIIMEQFCVY